MDIRAVEDVAALTAWQAVEEAARAVDHVGLPADPIEERLPVLDPATPDAGEKTLLRVAADHGAAVAAAGIWLPTLDNLASCSVDVRVHPDFRRRGFGRRLLTAVLSEVRELGRSIVFFESPSPYPSGPGAGEGLLRSVGARPVLREIRRLLDQSTVQLPAVDPAPYRLVRWVDTAPAELVAGLAELCARMSTDAPLGDMTYEPEQWDAARYRAKEASAQARQRQRFAVAAVDPAGQVAGMTDIGVNRTLPTVGYQWDTIVAPAHRGHRLGLAMKVANHTQLRALLPACRWVNTWNAASNTHMVAVNDALGFQPVECWTEWQLN